MHCFEARKQCHKALNNSSNPPWHNGKQSHLAAKKYIF